MNGQLDAIPQSRPHAAMHRYGYVDYYLYYLGASLTLLNLHTYYIRSTWCRVSDGGGGQSAVGGDDPPTPSPF